MSKSERTKILETISTEENPIPSPAECWEWWKNRLTWDDGEHIRFEAANEENGIQELPDDEIRRVWYGKLNGKDNESS